MPQATISDEGRRASLQSEIDRYVYEGYRVVSQTDTTAHLVRPKKFSYSLALLFFLLFGIGLLLYVLYYLVKRDDEVDLEVDTFGLVKPTYAHTGLFGRMGGGKPWGFPPAPKNWRLRVRK